MPKFLINEKIFEVVALATSLLVEHKLEYFEFDFCTDKSCRGYCTPTNKIKINYYFALYGDMGDIENTILHEIAHAIAGNENGHNEYWKSIAKELGVKNI